MISELDARLTSNALIINYAHDVETDMTDSNYVQDVQMSSQERRYLTELGSKMESGANTVRLAPSKLLRKPLSIEVRIHLPHLYYPDKQYKSYDIPWDLIEEDSIERSLYNTYKFVYIEMECDECKTRVLVPYMMPRNLSRIQPEMIELISLPQHFCLTTGWVATILGAEPVMPILHPWGNPARRKCQWSEVLVATDMVYKPFSCKVGTTNPSQYGLTHRRYQFDKNIEGTTLPMMTPFRMSFSPEGEHLKVDFVTWYPGGTLNAKVLFDIRDIMSASFIYTDLYSAHLYNHSVALPIHVMGTTLKEIKMNNQPQDNLFKVGEYPYGGL